MTEQDIQDINNQYQDQIVFYEKQMIKSAKEIIRRLEFDHVVGTREPAPNNPMTDPEIVQQYLHDMQRFLNKIHGAREKQKVIKDFYEQST